MTERRVLYLDLVGGAAGDMILSALVDAGAPLEDVRAALRALSLSRVTLEENEIYPAGLRAKQIEVYVDGVLGDSGAVEGAPHIHVGEPHSHAEPREAHHHHQHGPHFDDGQTSKDGDAATALPADGRYGRSIRRAPVARMRRESVDDAEPSVARHGPPRAPHEHHHLSLIHI